MQTHLKGVDNALATSFLHWLTINSQAVGAMTRLLLKHLLLKLGMTSPLHTDIVILRWQILQSLFSAYIIDVKFITSLWFNFLNNVCTL